MANICKSCGRDQKIANMCKSCGKERPNGTKLCVCLLDEAENRIQKRLGIEFKEGFHSNLIPTCLFFI